MVAASTGRGSSALACGPESLACACAATVTGEVPSDAVCEHTPRGGISAKNTSAPVQTDELKQLRIPLMDELLHASAVAAAVGGEEGGNRCGPTDPRRKEEDSLLCSCAPDAALQNVDCCGLVS